VAPNGATKDKVIVTGYLEILGASVMTFALTNIDDACLLTVLFAQRIPARRIVAGQYLGFTVIVVVSLLGAFAALAVPSRWVGLLGMVPIALGFRHLLKQSGAGPQSASAMGIASIALITFSNGADNIGLYVPFFIVGRAYLWLILVAYALLIGLWCTGSRLLGSHSLVLGVVDRWAHRVMPIVFIGLGLMILFRR
jgi:cadmium resistance protein CadD (predicted permease)